MGSRRAVTTYGMAGTPNSPGSSGPLVEKVVGCSAWKFKKLVSRQLQLSRRMLPDSKVKVKCLSDGALSSRSEGVLAGPPAL